mgnify:CR=1 FL=1
MCITQAFSQDKLMFLDGNEEDVKITEVSSSEVKYKRMNNLEGPTFSTLKSELFMIKYANGDKEMMATQNVESTPNRTAPSQEEYATKDESPASEANQVMSKSVVVNNEPAEIATSNVDQWGRDEAENRRLHKKKIKQGAVLMGVGGLTVGVGGTLLYLGNVNNSTSTVGPEDGVNRSVPTVALGVIGIVGGSAMLVSGAVLLGVSSKYKKRADALANGFYLNPSVINDFQYAGANIKNNSGFGFKLGYEF